MLQVYCSLLKKVYNMEKVDRLIIQNEELIIENSSLGSNIDEAVNIIRRMQEEIDRLTDSNSILLDQVSALRKIT